MRVLVRDLGPGRRDEFVAHGHLARHFFPHRVVRLPKGGPDGLKLARGMCGSDVVAAQLWELVLYALPPALDEFPAELFFDDDIVWHQQQFGLPGQVATATLVEDGTDLYVLNLVSDLVQRIGRRRDAKTRVENRFKGWSRVLLHAVLDFALDRGARRVLVASADLALAHTDRARTVQRPLFDRVYDRSVGSPYRAVRQGEWWVLDVATNADVLVRPPVDAITLSDEPQVCVCHDIERGWGHLHDPAFVAAIDADAPAYLTRMLDVEADAGIRATYSIVGFLVPELGERVRAAGHSVAFHSFDHAGLGESGAEDQLRHCRDVDYRIKGYRPAESRLTSELTDENLAFHNFEWLASSRFSLGADVPRLANGVVRIPILFDDFDLHNGAVYAPWERAAFEAVGTAGTVAFSLHDCYAPTWLPGYPELLRKVAGLGRLRTLDEVAADVLLGHAV
jgi:peptidoglycan/xylan/chitin deacetylase (PgdA/CDA1 family)